MPIFEANSTYASDVSITFDEQKQRYVGELVLSTGSYLIEGVDRGDVAMQIEAALEAEYRQMTLDVGHIRSRGRGGRGGGGDSDSHRSERIDGHRVQAADRGARGASAGQWVDMVSGGFALATGNWLEAALSTASLIGGDWLDGLFGGKKQGKKLFAVVFGGVMITAASRGELKKKLLRQKHRRMHMILSHIKMAREEHEKNSTTMDYSEAMWFGVAGRDKYKKRLKDKKRKAEEWRARVCSKGEMTGWRARTMGLRERVQSRKEKAEDFWSMRV